MVSPSPTTIATEILGLAGIHRKGSDYMVSSQDLCLKESACRINDGDLGPGCFWAMRALSYSLGVFHPEYRRAADLARQVAEAEGIDPRLAGVRP